MGIENERKFVLDVNEPDKFLNSLIHQGYTSHTLLQGYLNDQTRIRKSLIADKLEICEFTFKLMVNGKLIEVETEISELDFDTLWVKVGKVINKVRVKVPYGDFIWEIDFFMEEATGLCYLVMAEVEMPDGMEMPDAIPALVADYLLYLVPRTDKRFFNTQLVQPALVRKTIKDLKDGSKLHTS